MKYPDERYSAELQYRSAGEAWSQYWQAYGAGPGVTRSPYLHAAILLSVIMAPLWIQAGWWSDVIAILPSVLGFSIAALAMLMSFGDERFRALVARAGGTTPTYVRVIASFVHFIVVQTIALIAALVCKAWSFHLPTWLARALADSGVFTVASFLKYALWGIAFTIFTYALMCALSATLYIFRLIMIFVTVTRATREQAVRQRSTAEASEQATSERLAVPTSIQ